MIKQVLFALEIIAFWLLVVPISLLYSSTLYVCVVVDFLCIPLLFLIFLQTGKKPLLFRFLVDYTFGHRPLILLWYDEIQERIKKTKEGDKT